MQSPSLSKAAVFVTLLLLGCPPAAKDAQSAKTASKEKAKEKQPAPEPPFRSGGW